MHLSWRTTSAIAAAAALVAGGAGVTAATAATAAPKAPAHFEWVHKTATPIKHLVVIFQENISFDHYFGTYPNAANTSGQTFHAKQGTPSVNGLTTALLTMNPNGVNPRRYDPTNVNDVLTCDQDHDYHDQQVAFNGGKMNLFVKTLGTATGTSPTGVPCKAGDVMNYYDGPNVVPKELSLIAYRCA